MLLHIPGLLTATDLEAYQSALEQAHWRDGRISAGDQARQVKRNRQVDVTCPVMGPMAVKLQALCLANPLFQSACLPRAMIAPRFNAYAGGEHYGFHVDGSLQPDPLTGHILRTDVSCTVFLSAPDSYDGGELVISDTYGLHEVKLEAGDAILYPATSLHQVQPVTRGERRAAFFWIQSRVAEAQKRQMLFDLDMSLIRLRQAHGDSEDMMTLTAHYHNLVRLWAEG